MVKIVNLNLLKKKFGTLLSKLYFSASLSLEQISYIITYHDYFSFMENNNLDLFLKMQYSEIAKEIFNVEIIFDSDDINPVYWAGIQYINVATTLNIPLRQVFLLRPLKEMVAYYQIYHEINEKELINHFLNNEYKRSILSILMEEKNYSINNLATLTNISTNTIIHYKRDNNNLFNASFINIDKIRIALNLTNYDFFQKTSQFIMLTNASMENNEFKEKLKENICHYYKIDNLPLFTDTFKKGDAKGIYIGEAISLINDKNKRIVIDDDILNALIKNTYYEYLDV